MRTIMGRGDPHGSSSRRHLKWVLRKPGPNPPDDDVHPPPEKPKKQQQRKNQLHHQPSAAARIRAALLSALRPSGHVTLLGTLFGHRRGHVHLAFQADPKRPPVLLLELAAPTVGLVREMASGLVRVALECERKAAEPRRPLAEEPVWRTYCNGRKWGYAVRRECGRREEAVLRAVEPVTMGAGVLPATVSGGDGEVMYMRARFERVIGSRDSEAFYMIGPDGSTAGGPELSVYLLRL